MKDENLDKKVKRKKVLKIVRRSILALALVGITLSTYPSIEFESAYEHYKQNLPVIKEEETNKDYVKRLYAEAIVSNKNLSEEEKNKLIDVFNSLVIDKIGDYFDEDNIAMMMAVASTESIRELGFIEKKLAWYEGSYSKYLNQLVINKPIDEVKISILAHEQLHAIVRNSFNFHAYAFNEFMTNNSVEGDESYLYLNRYYNILSIIVGKEKLYKLYLDGDTDLLKEELSKYSSLEDVNRFLISSDDLVFSKFYSTFLHNIGINHNNVKEQDECERTNEQILINMFENRFNCKLENSSLGQVLFGYYKPNIEGLTLIQNKIGYYEPMCYLEYIDESSVKVIIELLTSNVNPSTKDFYRVQEEYIIDIDDFATVDLEDLIEDAKKKHSKDLVDSHLDKRYTLS